MLHLPLSKQVLDRAAELRSQESALDALLESGHFYHFIEGSWLIDGEKVATLSWAESQGLFDSVAGDLKNSYTPERYFLGLDSDRRGHFLIHHQRRERASEGAREKAGEAAGTATGAPVQPERERLKQISRYTIENLRSKVALFSPLHIGLVMHGQGLAFWHANHRFCSRCGKETAPVLGGSVRSCADGHQHHPRTDPAIITLIKDRADRILLGHQASWPAGRFSTFAGFVEPGESFEIALHREVAEEAGISISEFQYLGSQPWPFPSSVMIAFEAITEEPDRARPDGEEITEIRWFDRAALLEASRDGSLLLPPPISVARAMIDRWYEAGKGEPLSTKDAWR
jgi:NAD+ diphosphatase